MGALGALPLPAAAAGVSRLFAGLPHRGPEPLPSTTLRASLVLQVVPPVRNPMYLSVLTFFERMLYFGPAVLLVYTAGRLP
jgi:hypothetical protein